MTVRVLSVKETLQADTLKSYYPKILGFLTKKGMCVSFHRLCIYAYIFLQGPLGKKDRTFTLEARI